MDGSDEKLSLGGTREIKDGLYTHTGLNGVNLKGPEDAHMTVCAVSTWVQWIEGR